MSTPYTPAGGFPPQPPPQQPESFWRQYRVLICVLATVLGFGLASVGTAAAVTHHSSPAAVTAPVALGDGTSPSAVPSTTAPAPATVTPKPAKKATPAPGSVTHNGPTYNGPVTIINTAPQPGSTVYVPIPDSAPYYVTTNQGVVQQYYDYINAKNFSAAWDMGGKYIGGSDYQGWVNGYSTTSYVSLSTWDYYPGYNAVGVTISATQTDGTVRTYSGSYTVNNGAITSASIVQDSGSTGSGSGSGSAPASGLRYVGQLPGGRGGVYANPDTSSPFAMAVAGAYAGGGGSDYESVYSPTTHRSYGMTYTNVINETIQATGGTNVVVEFGYVP